MAEQTLLSKLKGRLIIGVAIGALVYLILVVLSGWGELKESLAAFNWLIFPLLLVLAFANYLFRFLKWDYYLLRLDITLPKKDSLIVFLSGLIGTITPGKIGELLKTYLVKQLNNTPIVKTAPIVIAERMTDFAALVIISIAGLTVFAVGNYLLVIALVVVILGGFIGVVGHRGLSMWLIGLLEKTPLIGRLGQKLHVMYESTHALLGLKPLTVATFWSLLAWLCECVGFWIVLKEMNAPVPVMTASFIYAVGTIVGAVSPGGLGVTEGSMVGFLQSGEVMGEFSMNMPEATAATMIIRAATLWFAVLVGAVVLLAFQSRFAGVAEMFDEERQTSRLDQ
jgi:glycosyltransferase 2 family protein